MCVSVPACFVAAEAAAGIIGHGAVASAGAAAYVDCVDDVAVVTCYSGPIVVVLMLYV